MNEQSILTAHIQALSRELSQAETNLGLPPDERLRGRMQDRFGDLIKEQKQGLEIVQTYVDQGQPLDACWNSFAIVRKKCHPVLSECLALTQGALARGAGLDDKLCTIADFLLDGLSARGLSGLHVEWGRFTILAEEEFFGNMAAVIRLRYPGASIWNLPVAAHEFGHFVVEKMEEKQDDGRFKDYVQQFHDLLPQVSQNEDKHTRRSKEQAQQEQAQRMFLHEYYADVFATYALGPAYAYTCLLLRFDPKTAYTDGQVHPSYEKRVHAILQTLEEMNTGGDSKGWYFGIIKNLRSWWGSNVEKARPSGQPTPGNELYRLEQLVKELHYRLDARMSRVRYSGWPQTAKISRQLADQQSVVAPAPGIKLRDVLNGAWRCRTNPPGGKWQNDVDLGKSAKVLCERILTQQEPKDVV